MICEVLSQISRVEPRETLVQVTDHPERFIVAELVREKVLHMTREEVPHSIAVMIEQIKRRENSDTVYIGATIIVERYSQKGIVIGKQGKILREVGKQARADIEALLGRILRAGMYVSLVNILTVVSLLFMKVVPSGWVEIGMHVGFAWLSAFIAAL